MYKKYKKFTSVHFLALGERSYVFKEYFLEKFKDGTDLNWTRSCLEFRLVKNP